MINLKNIRKDYRVKKQRIHAGLWMKEIEKLEEAKLGTDGPGGVGDDIEKLLDSCSEIFDSPDVDLSDWNDSKIPNASERGRHSPSAIRTSNGFLQVSASFIKTHIFSRWRPIDGWKYMIEEIGPNARIGKGSITRLPSLADPATQPFKEDAAAIPSGRGSSNFRGR